MTGAILSGGENRRIPVLKGFLTVGGRAIIERSVEVLGRVFDKVVISTNMPEKYFSLGVPLIGDIRKERGPLTGILSVLIATGEDAVFVIAGDMPFVSEKLIRFMAGHYTQEESVQGTRRYDAMVPVFNGRREPLFGVYAKTAAPVMDRRIENGQRSAADLLAHLRVRDVAEEEIRSVDPAGDSFVNINTMEDYERIGGKTCLV